MDFDYPDFEETIMKPKVPNTSVNPLSSSGSSQSLPSIQNGVTPGILSASMPSIDRSTKPKPDRSTKPLVTQIAVRTNQSDSLYPSMESISRPSTSNQSARKLNTDTRAEVHKSNTNTENEIANDLKELDRQKKAKEEELAKLQREFDRMSEESKSRMERLKEEEKRLSDLAELKRKEQTDVADLMR